ncbi:MAG: hypothetical protein N3F09_05880 [Bacteroidia bacterium]|nr:hypothetical protein [Bacteroidia bacterium]
MHRYFKFQHFIILFLGSFVLFILFLVYKTTQVHKENVQKNYFYEELKYNQLSLEMEQWDLLGIQTKISNNNIQIIIPDSALPLTNHAELAIYLKNLSDEKKDTSVFIKASTKNLISLANIPHNEYLMDIVLRKNKETVVARSRFKLKYPWKQF